MIADTQDAGSNRLFILNTMGEICKPCAVSIFNLAARQNGKNVIADICSSGRCIQKPLVPAAVGHREIPPAQKHQFSMAQGDQIPSGHTGSLIIVDSDLGYHPLRDVVAQKHNGDLSKVVSQVQIRLVPHSGQDDPRHPVFH